MLPILTKHCGTAGGCSYHAGGSASARWPGYVAFAYVLPAGPLVAAGRKPPARMTHDPTPSLVPEPDANAAFSLLHSAGILPAIFAALPGACLLLTPELRIAAVSDVYLASSLTTRAQLVGQYLFEAFLGAPGTPEGETMATLRANLQQVLATGQPQEMPVQHYRIADPATPGAVIERYWQPLNTPVLDEHHAVAGIVHTVVDVTDAIYLRESQVREQATALEADQQRTDLLRLLEQTPVAIGIIQGPDFVVEQANPALGTIWGRPAAEIVGRPFFEALPDLRGQGFEELFAGIRDRGESLVLREVPVDLAPDPRTPPTTGFFDCVYQPWRDAQGHSTGFIAVAVDVTEQVLARQQVEAQEKKTSFLNEELQAANQEILANNAELESAQQQLRQLNEELEVRVLARTQALLQAQAATEQEREQLYQVFEQTPVAIAIMRGPNLRVELANPAVAAIWGREPTQVLGRPYFEAVPDTAGQGFEQILSDVLTTGQPFTITEAPVNLARAHTGRPTQAYVNFVFQPLRDAAGATVGLIASGTEATEQVLARHRVQELNDKLQASNEELGTINQRLTRTNADLDTFVYTASHDLKVPIANIEGLLDALGRELRGAAVGDTVPQLLRMMLEAVARFQQTIGHLTDISRLQQESSPTPEHMSLAAIIADVQLDLAPLLQTTAAQLTIDLADAPELPLSPKNLRSVVYNLLSNALKYRAPGRVPTVHIRCQQQGTHAVLTVQDNGLGLDERQQQRLFKLFQRLHTHVEGSGVGLYMVRKIVENVGGNVQVQSTVGVGTTFLVTLPLPRERSTPASA